MNKELKSMVSQVAHEIHSEYLCFLFDEYPESVTEFVEELNKKLIGICKDFEENNDKS
ncbi:hypothetical protein Pm5461_165 [Proteus phage vB_PmiM_Pm5461]|uniref:Uncharacterized protein n=1 Tax=Proteus phage vB_PmiM_Pm5461 TaxID=1636250 RepID=A0A0G2SSL0_9CAUD|nr:hypothetical protein AVT59_gp206 [Proteus phage vB_PmiM_Pm5461]AKA62031.1 hypothetical protein Pm5461_165 [Proteus phage vB_PmiM_Pm5461]